MQNQQDKLDKQLLAVDREIKKLRSQYYVIQKLDTPHQCGWIRYYALSDKANNHKHRQMLQDILKLIGTQRWSRYPNFRKVRHLNKMRRLMELEHPLKTISRAEWEHYRFPDSWKAYFRLELKRYHKVWHPTYVFSHRGLLELRTEPQIVTELRVPDPAIQQRVVELERWLKLRQHYPRLDWLKGHRTSYQTSRPQSAYSKLAAQEIAHALRTYPEVDASSCMSWAHINLQSKTFPDVVQQQRHSAQTGASVGATPTIGSIFTVVSFMPV